MPSTTASAGSRSTTSRRPTRAIVAKLVDPTPDRAWLDKVVEVVRSTRAHPDVRIGSSVRGAIDIAAVAASLAPLRHSSATAFDVGLDSAIVALSGRLRLRDGVSRTAESVVTELWNEVFTEREPGTSGKATAPDGATRRTS